MAGLGMTATLTRRGIVAGLAVLPAAGTGALLNPAQPYVRRMHELARALAEQPLPPKPAEWAGWCLQSAGALRPLDFYKPFPVYSSIVGVHGFAAMIAEQAKPATEPRRLADAITRLALDLADLVNAERERAFARGEIDDLPQIES